MKIFLKMILAFALICFISSENIIRDPNFPLFVTPNRHSVDQSTMLEFRFQLPSRRSGNSVAGGLEFNQYFALRFQDSILNFTSNLPGCAVTVGTTTYMVAPFTSENAAFSNVNSNSNYFFCKLTDTINSRIAANVTITLTLTFTNQLTTRFISNISLYTTTSNNVDNMVIDSLPNFGSIGLYNNYLTSTNNKFMRITSDTNNLAFTTSPATTSPVLYPNFTFDLKFNLQIGQLFNLDPEDFFVVLQYDTISFSNPTSLSTEAISTIENEKALSGPLTITELSGRGLIIEGFLKADMYDGRKTRLVFPGMKSNDKQINKRTEMELFLYYRNTYSIISHSTLNMDIVNRVLMSNVSVHHPEYFYMYDGMGWPFQFNFKFQSDLPEGGWVVIRQKDYDIKSASVVLVASSCDFSETTLEQSYGKRWNCYPLRNDFRYDTSSGDVTREGQGIYFRLSSIQSSIESYKIKVWGFIDKCYLSGNFANHYAQSLTFSIRLFKFGFQNNTLLNEKIFFGNANNYVLAESFATLTEGCFPLQPRGSIVPNLDLTLEATAAATGPFRIPKTIGTGNLLKHPIGIEITNFNIIKPPSTIANLFGYYLNANTAFQYLGTTASDTTNDKTTVFVKKFLYSTATDLPSTNLMVIGFIPTVSYVTLGTDAKITAANGALHLFVPSECVGVAADSYMTTTHITEPRIQFIFSRQFLTQGNSITSTTGCHVGWTYHSGVLGSVTFTAPNGRYSALAFDTTAGSVIYRIRTIITSVNAAVTNDTTKNTYRANMDQNLSKIDSSANATGLNSKFVITSNTFPLLGTTLLSALGQLNHDGTNNKYTLSFTAHFDGADLTTGDHCIDNTQTAGAVGNTLLGTGTSGNHITSGYNKHSVNLAIYTTCLSFSAIPSTVKTMNTYFEIQKILLSNGKHPMRIVRLIKLFPEVGIFNDGTEVTATPTTIATLGTLTSDAWITSNYQVTTNGSAPFAVCLIEINSYYIDQHRGTSNTLAIWLFATSLIDVDINDVSSEYPVSPLPSATAYALNSGQTMSLGFRRIGDPLNISNVTELDRLYPNKILAFTNATQTDPGSAGTIDTNRNVYSEFEYYFYQAINKMNLGISALDRALPSNFAGFPDRHSLYHMYLGSLIIIPGISASPTGNTTNTFTNLFIPFLCPSTGEVRTTTDYPANPIYFTHPIITIGWMTTDKYNSISKFNKYVLSPNLGRTVAANRLMRVDPAMFSVHTPLFRIGHGLDYNADITADNHSLRNSLVTHDALLTSRGDSLQELEVRFLRYNLTTDNNDKRFTMNLVSGGTSRRVSAISMFLSPRLPTITASVTHDITSNSTNNQFKVKSLNSNIFIMGQPFNKFLAFTDYNGVETTTNTTTPPSTISGRIIQRIMTGTAQTSDSFSFSNTLTVRVEGITRPTLDTLDNVTAINPLNFLAIFMTSRSNYGTTNVWNLTGDANSNYRIITNFRTNGNETSSFNNFILWHPTVVQSTWSASLQADTQYVATNENKGANLKINATLPSEVPIGSSIELTFSGTTVQQNLTKCGLVENGIDKIVTECSVTTGIITCKNIRRATLLDICCYNIYDNGTPSTTFELSTGKVILTHTIATGVFTTYPTTWYEDPVTGTNNRMAILAFTNRKIEPISDASSSFYPKLERIRYNFSSTVGGFGLAIFDINLPRNAVRGMILEINADLSAMKIINMPARVTPSFGSSELYGFNPDLGDIFLDSVYTNLDSNGIKLRLKNIIYKCRVGLTNNIVLYIWPVITPNYTALSVSINMKAADGSSLAANGKHTVPSPSLPNSAPTINTISQSFFTITNIQPKIVDEIASYDFNFSFNQFSSNLESETANEIVLFLNHIYFGDYPNIICYNGNTLLQCNFLYKSILSIRFNGNINLTGDSAVVIKIYGFRNPFLASNNGIYFAASVNRTNFITQNRKTILRGITTISEGITFNAGVTYGNFIFRNKMTLHTLTVLNSTKSTSITNQTAQGFEIASEELLNPREIPRLYNDNYTSLHQFAISLDLANNFISNWDNGYIIDKSPVLYITFPSDYKFHWYTFTPIYEFVWVDISNTDLKSTQESLTKLTVATSTMIGNTLRITFNQTSITFTRFFSHLLIKIYNLPTPVESTTNTTTNRVTTERFELLLLNSDSSIVFKTWTNLNTFSNQNVLVGRPNLLLARHKGFKYEYDQRKYIIDVSNKANNTFNNISIKAGTFNKYSFKVRSTSRLLSPERVNVVLDNQLFSFDKPFYTVASAIKSDMEFLIGVPCNTNPGTEIVRTSFVSSSAMNPYNNFLPLSPIIITINTEEVAAISFIQNNVVRINGSLFVDFNVTESPFDNLSILFTPASESLIENTILTKGTFTTRTVFKITNSSAVAIQSFNLGNPNNACFKFNSEKINFTIDGVAAIIPNDAIKREMFDYRNSNTDTTISKSSVKFIFTTEYTQIYVYAALTCLNDEFPTDEQLKNQNVTQTPRMRYFSEILNIQGNANLVFNNLIRGVSYKLKVLIESTQGDKSLRTSSKLDLLNITLSNGTIIPIIASRTFSPLCASFRFKSRPGIQITNPLLWYWQDKYSGIGYYETGCISVVDQYGTEIPGLPLIKNETSCGVQNCRFINRESFVVNQTALDIAETYTLCAYQFSTCSLDPTNYQETFNDLLSTFATNTTMNTALQTKVVPEFSVNTVTNQASLNSPTLSNISFSAGRLTFNGVSTTPLQCFLVISNTQPLANQFETCSSGCTTINTSSQQGSYSINVGSSISGSQSIYATCYNDMPCSSARTNVLSLGSFTASTTNNNNNNSTSNNTNNNNNTNTNSDIYKINSIILLLIALLMMN